MKASMMKVSQSSITATKLGRYTALLLILVTAVLCSSSVQAFQVALVLGNNRRPSVANAQRAAAARRGGGDDSEWYSPPPVPPPVVVVVEDVMANNIKNQQRQQRRRPPAGQKALQAEITTMEQLDAILDTSRNGGDDRPVILKFYASWYVHVLCG